MTDPENPVVKLCVAGMQAEGKGDFESAQRIFTQAWETATDDFEACIAAHYVARHQPSAEETLRWNREAFRLAEAVNDERVASFFPSLLLNLGHSYEGVGQATDARRYYDLAAARSEALASDRYGALVREGVAAAQRRAHEDPA